ncbi:hypothetical protein C8Q74DRAFT_1187467 [Fomes fomentarius]|nr:hypothetical protein C8Q74DRAFT_1187467 [Fomes fomentarius]
MSRRVAGQKASRLAAEQLASSPIPESDGGITFGEPSTSRSPVKVTYGSKRKRKQSPSTSRAGTSTNLSPTRPRALSLMESSPNKQPVGNGQGGGRSRRNSRTRSTSPTSSIENDSLAHSDPDIILLDEDPQLAKLARRNTVSGAESRSADTRVTTSHGANGQSKGARKRPLSRSSSDGEGDSLIRSSSPERKKRYFPPPSNIAPRLARQFMRVQSQLNPTTVSEHKQQTITQSKSLDNLFAPLDSTDDESGCDDTDTGSLVWVSINMEGKLADCTDGGREDTLWWPAKVELPKPLMRLTLYGHPPGMDGDRRLSIPNPSPSNVRSMMLDGHIRFNDGNYRTSRGDSVHSSPQKKPKLDLDAAWREARGLMVKADEDGDEALLATTSQYADASSATQDKYKRNGKGKGKAIGSDFDEWNLNWARPERRWRAPSANPLLEIPGELVLAKEGKTRTQYWPAKLLSYVKPTKPTQKPKYEVRYFDGTVKEIEPDWFWTTTDDEFATCNLGESRGNYGLDYDNDALDEKAGTEDFSRPFEEEDEAKLRALSPLPELPAPSPSTFEYGFDIVDEFEYIKPVLASVIENEYEPSRARHENFMRGGGARQKVLDMIPLRGSLNGREKEELAFYVRSWARRRDRRREMGLNVDYPRDKLYPPPYGRRVGTNEHVSPSSMFQESDIDSALTPTSDISMGDTETVALSEVEAPPSSFGPTEAGTDDEELAIRKNLLAHEVSVCGSWQRVGQQRTHDLQPEVPGRASSATSEVRVIVPPSLHMCSNPTHVQSNPAQIQSSAVSSNEDKTYGAPRPARRMSFYDLDPLEKITYCNNVLLQEAIFQILLWRTGHRKALGLLSPEEERRLHDIARKEGEKTNWVHDIIRLRQAVEKKMLPSAKAKGSHAASAAGTRTRARRGP